jgi:hypothetical protein
MVLNEYQIESSKNGYFIQVFNIGFLGEDVEVYLDVTEYNYIINVLLKDILPFSEKYPLMGDYISIGEKYIEVLSVPKTDTSAELINVIKSNGFLFFEFRKKENLSQKRIKKIEPLKKHAVDRLLENSGEKIDSIVERINKMGENYNEK